MGNCDIRMILSRLLFMLHFLGLNKDGNIQLIGENETGVSLRLALPGSRPETPAVQFRCVNDLLYFDGFILHLFWLWNVSVYHKE